MICGRADAASGPLNGGPGGGSAGAASVVWCRVLVERISINVLNGQRPISLFLVHSSHVPQPERPLGRHVVPARAVASAWSAEEPESGGSASACASACRGTGQRTLVPTTRRMPGAGLGVSDQTLKPFF